MDHIPEHKYPQYVARNLDNIPDEFIVPNPYNIPGHYQGDKNNCTSHAFALMMEYKLSKKFKMRTLIDVEDLWNKQLKFGTATEEGDHIDGPFLMAERYGMKFKMDDRKKGIYFINGGIVWDGSVRFLIHNLENKIRYFWSKFL